MEKDFSLSPMGFEELERFVDTPQNTPQFVLYLKGQLTLCRAKNWMALEPAWGKSIARLSVAWSDNRLLQALCAIDETTRAAKISYQHDLMECWKQRDKAEMIIFHARPAVTDVTDVADEKRFMPQKTTYFFPKLAAGFIMRNLNS